MKLAQEFPMAPLSLPSLRVRAAFTILEVRQKWRKW
jgi:hypothetical protein